MIAEQLCAVAITHADTQSSACSEKALSTGTNCSFACITKEVHNLQTEISLSFRPFSHHENINLSFKSSLRLCLAREPVIVTLMYSVKQKSLG